MTPSPKKRARSSAGFAGAIRSGGGLGGGRRGPLRQTMGGEAPLRAEYPRDLVGYARERPAPQRQGGYGRKLPDPKWPGGARLALQIVMNYEEGGERSLLHGDKEAEAYLQEVVGLPTLRGARNLTVESMFEYGTRAGFWRLMRTFG